MPARPGRPPAASSSRASSLSATVMTSTGSEASASSDLAKNQAVIRPVKSLSTTASDTASQASADSNRPRARTVPPRSSGLHLDPGDIASPGRAARLCPENPDRPWSGGYYEGCKVNQNIAQCNAISGEREISRNKNNTDRRRRRCIDLFREPARKRAGALATRDDRDRHCGKDVAVHRMATSYSPSWRSAPSGRRTPDFVDLAPAAVMASAISRCQQNRTVCPPHRHWRRWRGRPRALINSARASAAARVAAAAFLELARRTSKSAILLCGCRHCLALGTR